MSEPIIICKNLCKKFDLYTDYKYAIVEYLLLKKRKFHTEHYAINNISFLLDKGGVLGIIGDNGAGKSMLLKIISGSILPTSGELSVRGVVSSLIDIQSGFKRDFNGIDNIRMNLVISGFYKDRQKGMIEKIIDFAELGDFIKYPISSYSTGMLMRLGFSIASTIAEDIFVVDEHIAVGDNYFMRKCIERLKELHREKKTLVIVSHSMHLIANLCTKVIWLENGKIRMEGDPPTVVRAYEDYILKKNQKEVREKKIATSNEAKILNVKICDRSGNPREVFDTCEDVFVEVEAFFNTKVTNPVFGVALFKEDGRYIYGPNTFFDRFETGVCEGKIKFRILYEELPLLAGKYQISVAIFDPEHVFPYDFHEKRYNFEIRNNFLDHGDIRIKHKWFIEKG